MSHSPSYYAWQRLKKNRPAFAGLIFVCFCVLVSIAGPLILPDKTPDSNEQMLEIETRRPGFTVEMLKIRKAHTAVKNSLLTLLTKGEESDYTLRPLNGYRFFADKIRIAPYSEEKTSADSETYALKAVAYGGADTIGSLPSKSLMGEGNKDGMSGLREKVKAENLLRRTYWLGTDRYGRDMLSRLLLGTRISLSVGFISVIISLIVGIFLGAIAGFFRGWADVGIQWFINVVWSVPTLLLVMAVSLILGRGFWQVFIAVGLTMWVDVARMVRGQILSARELEYVQAGKALGFGNFRLIFRHILPNILGPVMVISAANFASAIVLESGLSFLGLGVQPPAPSWGVMLNDHFGYVVMGSAYLAILPGMAIMFLVLAFNLLGNGLRDALDVRMK
jgi:peptide/nickel transport system permease protein